MQTKLDQFFKVEIQHNPLHKKCFIYDPEQRTAFFDTMPDSLTDVFLTTKIGVKLYYRQPSEPSVPLPLKPVIFPSLGVSSLSVPLLKSNLQKAVRRCQTDVAISSALAILQKEPIELLRRLPILYIEDVCLMDSYPVVVWLMMAEKEHPLDNRDIDTLLQIVKNLCETRVFYDPQGLDQCQEPDQEYELSHASLQDLPNKDAILALYYRSLYGGLKGDMKMLRNAVYYYSCPKTEILKTHYDAHVPMIVFQSHILPEAIDFHPFPAMISTLAKLTQLDKDVIRQCIWTVESGVNVRKPDTITAADHCSQTIEWKQMESVLARVRHSCIYENKKQYNNIT